MSILNNWQAMVAWIGIADAALILILGLVSAAFWLFDIKAEKFFERIIPSVGILIATSVAAGIVVAITRWVVS